MVYYVMTWLYVPVQLDSFYFSVQHFWSDVGIPDVLLRYWDFMLLL